MVRTQDHPLSVVVCNWTCYLSSLQWYDAQYGSVVSTYDHGMLSYKHRTIEVLRLCKNWSLFPWPYGMIMLSMHGHEKLSSNSLALNSCRCKFSFALSITWYDHDIDSKLWFLPTERPLIYSISDSMVWKPRHDHD